MKRHPAFTLLEVFIALILSSFIIVGMMQLYQSVIKYLEASRDLMGVDRKACLMLNQMERDLSSAYIPFLAKEEKSAKEPSTTTPPESEKTEDKTKEAAKKKERLRKFFVGAINDRAELIKIDGKKAELFKHVSFICSNPLEIFEEKRRRLVRVVYELVADKSASLRDITVYKLVRKETTDLENMMAKVDEYAPDKKQSVRQYIVADNVKGLFLQYAMPEPEKESKKWESGQEKKEQLLFEWGSRPETQGIVPQKIHVWLDLWDEKKTRSFRYHKLLWVMSYPTVDEDERKKKVEAKAEAKIEKKEQEKTPPVGAPPITAPQQEQPAGTPTPSQPGGEGGESTAPASDEKPLPVPGVTDAGLDAFMAALGKGD